MIGDYNIDLFQINDKPIIVNILIQSLHTIFLQLHYQLDFKITMAHSYIFYVICRKDFSHLQLVY